MRRSDAVREIKKIIATCGPTQPTIVTAEQVLSRLEKLGMMPPGMNNNGDGESFDYEWEPEERTFCIDCGIETLPGISSARCKECWDDKVGR